MIGRIRADLGRQRKPQQNNSGFQPTMFLQPSFDRRHTHRAAHKILAGQQQRTADAIAIHLPAELSASGDQVIE
jgi:hypothetical protein